MADVKEVIKGVMTEIYKTRTLAQYSMAELGKGGYEFKPVSSFKLTYDAAQNQLEPIYYWILDFIEGQGYKVEKIVDNFMSSPGSGHFSEMGQRATRMQEEGMKILGGLNQVIKSALNLIYDLKEFRMRLKHYEDYREGDKKIQSGAFLALKQVWLDSVDLPKRGDGSIHGMSSKLGYTTLREAFIVAEDLDHVDRMGTGEDALINESIVRIVKPRLKEFFDWIDYSEHELRKRYNIEKSYLKSQIGTIKLYSGWVKPYLKAAEELRQRGFEGNAALVNAFSTSMFQLTIKAVPKEGGKRSKRREYLPVLIIDFQYRGHLLQRANQRGDFAPAVSGKVDMVFDAYALNNEELELVKKEMDREDLKDSLEMYGDYATEAIDEMEEDLREFLGEEDMDKFMKKEKKKKEKNSDDINPFAALFSLFTNFGKSKEEKKKGKEIESAKEIKKDNWTEKKLRFDMAEAAAAKLFNVYDIYKKAHDMASSPTPFENAGDMTAPSTTMSDVWSWDWK